MIVSPESPLTSMFINSLFKAIWAYSIMYLTTLPPPILTNFKATFLSSTTLPSTKIHIGLTELPKQCTTKLGGLNRNVLSHSLRGWKSKIRVS